jgi:hypothetical protein
MRNNQSDRANLTNLDTRRQVRKPETGTISPARSANSPDELAISIQASVSEIAVIWMLHKWSLTPEIQSEPLHQQIRNFSPVAFDVIVSRFPTLKSAKQEHLWLIYFKGLLTAGTHPREEMTRAIQTVGARDWIRISPAAPSMPPPEATASTDTVVQLPHGEPSDADALEQISRALGHPAAQDT